MACCGKIICSGCIHSVQIRDKKSVSLCPFCRTPSPSSEKETIERYKKRMGINDSLAIYNLGSSYFRGRNGLTQNYAKALELWLRAGELGCATAYNNLGYAYVNGVGVERDIKMGKQYWELAAMKGDSVARHNLGWLVDQGDNTDRALKHFMIAVEGGKKNSLGFIKGLYSKGHATKADYANALRSYQAYLDEVKSKERDEVVAHNRDQPYY